MEDVDVRRRSVPECTGACCDPVRIHASAYLRLRLDPSIDDDGPALLDMLEGPPDPDALLDLAVVDRINGQRGIPGSVRLHLSCRHFDTATRRCGIYEARPRMCSSYPNGGTCEFCGAIGTPEEEGDQHAE
jgi:Fe-S-cluster containining protein